MARKKVDTPDGWHVEKPLHLASLFALVVNAEHKGVPRDVRWRDLYEFESAITEKWNSDFVVDPQCGTFRDYNVIGMIPSAVTSARSVFFVCRRVKTPHASEEAFRLRLRAVRRVARSLADGAPALPPREHRALMSAWRVVRRMSLQAEMEEATTPARPPFLGGGGWVGGDGGSVYVKPYKVSPVKVKTYPYFPDSSTPLLSGVAVVLDRMERYPSQFPFRLTRCQHPDCRRLLIARRGDKSRCNVHRKAKK